MNGKLDLLKEDIVVIKQKYGYHVFLGFLVIASFLNMTAPSFAERSEQTDSDLVKTTISGYFNRYYHSYVDGNLATFGDIMENNDNIATYQALYEKNFAYTKTIHDGCSSYDARLDFTRVKIDGKSAKADVIMSVDYYYKGENIPAGPSNIKYVFELGLFDGVWKITKIDSDNIENASFQEEIEKEEAEDEGIKDKKDAIEIVKKKYMNDINKLHNEIKKQESQKNTRTLNANLSAAAVSVSYSATNGRAYALRFAELEVPWFYDAGANCTNFVSQCIWAGCGGYVVGNDTLSKNNMNNKVRMVPGTISTGWFAGTGGGAANWESVTKLWSYVTSSKTTGPVGTGYNNNSLYTNMTPSQIKKGNVLQVADPINPTYHHSVYVVTEGTTWSAIRVAQHTGNDDNRPLSDLVLAHGGSSCKLRRIAFSSAKFAK